MKTLSLHLVCGIALAALILPASASAQATRTWVSGVGDDANPCSRTAPCKTFAGAISKTAAGGEINCTDPGPYGNFTIPKSISIKCAYTEAGILAGTPGIVVNASANANVVLEGLDINGVGIGQNGLRIVQAKSVKFFKGEIYGFTRNGIDMEASNSGAKLVVTDSHIFDNGGNGVLVAPPSGGNSTATLRNNVIANNGCGITATNHLPDPAFDFTIRCGTQASGVGGPAKIEAFGNLIADHSGTNGIAVFSNGQSSSIRIGDNEITGNTIGMQASDTGIFTGHFGGIYSWGDNYLAGNVTDGDPNGTIGKK